MAEGTRLTFLGAAGTVTGSRFLVETPRARVLVDCGLFQGYKHLRLRNREPFAVDPSALDAVVVTHAHIDHTGYLPRLVANGYAGRVLATHATRHLADILLPDSAHLQEEDARYANLHGFSKHRPALPLYTTREAEGALRAFQVVDFHRDVEVAPGVTARWSRAGHILGAGSVLLDVEGTRVFFSGDVGRPRDPLMRAPEPPPEADFAVVESTYGDRRHEADDPAEALASVVARTAQERGVLLVPAFAVGRTQEILYHLHRLREAGRIPDVPVFVDSPMATEVGEVFVDHPDEHRLSAKEARAATRVAHYVRTSDESRGLDARGGPMVIVAGSGMMTGGRILHHVKRFGPRRSTTILFAGFQAGGTRGDALLRGARTVRIHGADVEVNARLEDLPGASAHADADELLAWLRGTPRPPRRTWLVHGEPPASEALRRRVQHELGWRVDVAEDRRAVSLA